MMWGLGVVKPDTLCGVTSSMLSLTIKPQKHLPDVNTPHSYFHPIQSIYWFRVSPLWEWGGVGRVGRYLDDCCLTSKYLSIVQASLLLVSNLIPLTRKKILHVSFYLYISGNFSCDILLHVSLSELRTVSSHLRMTTKLCCAIPSCTLTWKLQSVTWSYVELNSFLFFWFFLNPQSNHCAADHTTIVFHPVLLFLVLNGEE